MRFSLVQLQGGEVPVFGGDIKAVHNGKNEWKVGTAQLKKSKGSKQAQEKKELFLLAPRCNPRKRYPLQPNPKPR